MNTHASTSTPAPVRVPFGSVAPGFEFDLRLFHECDDAFFAEVDRRLRPCLEAVTWRWARDSDHADDLEQMTMIRIYEKRASYSGRGSLLAWAWSVCANVCKEEARRPGNVETVALDNCGDLADPAPVPDELLERRLRAAAVRKALAELDDREREAVWALHGEGRSLTEVARSMGINARTAAVLARRGLDELASMDELAEAVLDDE